MTDPITEGNEHLIAAALADIDADPLPDPVTPEAMHELFKSARKAKGELPATPAGPHASDKAASADALAVRIADAIEEGQPVHVPDHLRQLFDFLYPQPQTTAEEPAPGQEPETTHDKAEPGELHNGTTPPQTPAHEEPAPSATPPTGSAQPAHPPVGEPAPGAGRPRHTGPTISSTTDATAS
ncbi:hypothetical protein [Streptomyces sp. NPDC001480]|uniref:hypothetical protein n=1 Tax=Streptomyces sp. NPDC001480 TaxID=3364577 RepID=UPI0036C3D338